jgi:hypothetical protein
MKKIDDDAVQGEIYNHAACFYYKKAEKKKRNWMSHIDIKR